MPDNPIYHRDGIQLFCGDNVEIMRTLPAASVDLTVTSPPYDDLRSYSAGKPMSELWNFESVAQELWRLTKPGGVVVWVVADATVNGSETGTSFRQALRFMEIGFRLHDTMIYRKPNPIPVMAKHRYTQSFEFMFVFCKSDIGCRGEIRQEKTRHAGKSYRVCRNNITSDDGGAVSTKDKVYVTKETRDASNIWDIETDGPSEYHDHPAIFPEDLARDHILSWSNEGDTILDPFSGSSTTLKMAWKTGRKAIGIEINPEYCDIGIKRLEKTMDNDAYALIPAKQFREQQKPTVPAKSDPVKLF